MNKGIMFCVSLVVAITGLLVLLTQNSFLQFAIVSNDIKLFATEIMRCVVTIIIGVVTVLLLLFFIGLASGIIIIKRVEKNEEDGK